MKAVLEGREGNIVKFNFEIPAEDFSKAIDKVYRESRKYFTVPGFRKGRAPRQIIEMTYGKEIFFEDAAHEVLPEVYDSAVEELGLYPVNTPEIDLGKIVKGENITVNATVEVKPEVELGDYKSIEVEKVDFEVSEDIVNEEIENIRNMNARIIDAGDRTEVKAGDLVTLDYEGFVDGEAFEGGKAEEFQLEIGSKKFIPGFEEALIGKNKGEESEIQVTFPEDYGAEHLAGKEATFKIEIHDIKEKELPELDDEFVKDVSEFDTLDEYKKDIREKLEKDFAERAKFEEEMAILNAISEIATVDIPEGMIQTQIENEMQDFNQKLSMQGLGLDQYMAITNTSKEDLANQLRPMAEEKVKGDLVLEAIAEAEGFEVSEEDRLARLKEMAAIYRPGEEEDFVEEMKDKDLSFLDTVIVNEKVLEFLKETVKFK